MSQDHRDFFTHYFVLLSGRTPYPWQTALFERLIRGEVPDSVRLPTGAGKTAIILIWLIALAWSSTNCLDIRLPRRIVWVVNRRVVVDQASEEAETIRTGIRRLSEGDPLRRALNELGGGTLLAVSALRGQLADNGDWSRNPAVPAIVIGTVDMVGSRLLFRGYGDSKYWRPYHAGLLGVDSLIVNDESHLTPAFGRLLLAIRALAPAAHSPHRFHVMLVSATEGGLGDRPFEHSLDDDVAASDRFRSVYDAEKRLWLDEAADRQSASRRLLSIALKEPAPRTIVFVESPEEALVKFREIRKVVGPKGVELMTGTMRGHERDGLAQSAVFLSFLQPKAPDKPVFLVATSAAEVGVNLTCERMVTTLVPSDQLLQRLGRLNRFGDQDGGPHMVGDAYIVYVAPKAKEAAGPVANCLQYLRGLPPLASGSRNISCRTLRDNPPAPETRNSDPPIAPIRAWLLDVWAMTSIPDSAVPPVEHWLHGKQDGEAPVAEVAWREEANWLSRDGVDPIDLQRAFSKLPVQARERLREPARRVWEKLQEIGTGAPDSLGLLITTEGDVRRVRLVDLGEADLYYSLVVLPPQVGGIESGMFTAATTPGAPYDVADAEGRRFYVTEKNGMWDWQEVGTGRAPEVRPDPRRDRQGATVIEVPQSMETEDERHLLVFLNSAKKKGPERSEMALDDHLHAAARQAASLALMLLPLEVRCFEAAAMVHDLGKAHPLWQTAMGGDVESPKAKTLRATDPRMLDGYRHELRSVVLAETRCCAYGLHLVGSHHGWCRPHFETRAYDPNEPEISRTAALAATRRFGQLQARYGHWGLAYRETVFKAIDGFASEATTNG